MIVVRFKVTCKPEKTDEVMDALKAVVFPSRNLDGVIHFDVGRDIVDSNSFFSVEVFNDKAALDAQEAQAEVEKAMALFEESLEGEPESTIFHVSSSELHT